MIPQVFRRKNRNFEAESPEAIYEKYVTGSKALYDAHVVKTLFIRFFVSV